MTFKLISINVPSKNGEAARKFYSALTGVEAARSLSESVEAYNIPLTSDGTWLWLPPPQHEKDNGPVAYFAVDNLSKATKLAQSNGAEVLGKPIDMPIASDFRDDYARILSEPRY